MKKLLRLYPVFLIGCSAGMSSSVSNLSSLSSQLDPGAIQQAAQINCTIKDVNTSETVQLHTILSLDTTFQTSPTLNDTLLFDCSNTNDAAGNLKFSMDPNYISSSPQFVAKNNAQFSVTLNKTGIIPMAIQVVDGASLVRVKTFNIPVKCSAQVVPVVNASNVSITPTGKLNYFNYAVSGVTGGNNFKYAWDFNGDGVYDSFDLSGNIWSTNASLANIYTLYADQRTIGLKVVNDCGFEADVVLHPNFVMPNIDRTSSSLAVAKPYFYLQSDISSSTLQDARHNVDFLGTQYPGDPFQRTEPDYQFHRVGQPASFTLKSHNWYTGGTQEETSSALLHGMDFKVDNIPDSGQMGEQVFTETSNTNGVKISSINYIVSAGSDGIAQERFGLTNSCSLTIHVKRSAAVQPCSAGMTQSSDFTESVAVEIFGEFDCPTLVDSSNRTIAAHNGKFYSQVGPADQCIGGGGGGGGAPPPRQ